MEPPKNQYGYVFRKKGNRDVIPFLHRDTQKAFAFVSVKVATRLIDEGLAIPNARRWKGQLAIFTITASGSQREIDRILWFYKRVGPSEARPDPVVQVCRSPSTPESIKAEKSRRENLIRLTNKEAVARRFFAPGKHTEEEWSAILERYGNRCLRCGSTEDITKDHVVSIAKGGSNDASNLQPLCRKCNCSKREKIQDFRHDHIGKESSQVSSLDGVSSSRS